MKLYYRTIGEGPPLIIMHGVFGSSNNWQTLGKVFSEKHKVLLPDMRNHGRSPHSEDFSYELMVDDVMGLMEDEGLDQVNIMGHSMGGKVGMHLAAQFPDRTKRLIVVDIAPKYYPPHHRQIFDGFRSVHLDKIASRKEADEQMAHVISNFGVRQFILKNLVRNDEGAFQWKLNVGAIERSVEKMGQGLEEETGYDGETLFISGGKSDYILSEDHSIITTFFPKAKIEHVDGAGHWVHAEKPEELSKLVLDFMA